MKLAFVISSLVLGGAERVLSLVANGLATRGHEVTVFTFSPPDATAHYPMHPHIRIANLGLAGESGGLLAALGANLRRVRTIRQELRSLRPQALVSFMDATNVLCLLASRGLAIPVVVAEHIDPSHHDIGPLWTFLRQHTYPLAASVLMLTSGLDAYFPKSIRKRCEVMPNPVEADCSGPCHLPLRGRCIVGLGRLSPQKGFDVLLHAFARVAPRHPDAQLWILGEGPDRPVLESLRNELGLAGRAHLPGLVPHPGPVLSRAHIFALSSRYEGFPLALCEALACGAATVSTTFSAGATDIVRNGENALIVPAEDSAALADALNQLFDDEPLRRRLAARAPEILTRFGLEKVLDMWEALLGRVAGKGA